MKWVKFGVGALALGLILLVVAGLAAQIRHGFSARDEPTAAEAFMALRLRKLSIPGAAKKAKNPVRASAEILADARAHFADHCAICHANNGNGDTPIGRNLYPKAPDMRAARTQALSDGELFYLIHNGIRLTGMPAWGSGRPEEDRDSWKLVHFIRHLPELTAEELSEMETLNPKGAHERQEGEAMQAGHSGDASGEKSPGDHHGSRDGAGHGH